MIRDTLLLGVVLLLCGVPACAGDDDGCAPSLSAWNRIAISYAAAGAALPALNATCGGGAAGAQAFTGDPGNCITEDGGSCAPGSSGDAGPPAPSCARASDDNACAACLKSACCAEGLACVGDTACTDASNPAYVALKACASSDCKALCPGLQ
jgi:hypothetical protein